MGKNSQEINSDTSAFRSYFDIIKKAEVSHLPEAMEVDNLELTEFNPLEGVQDWTINPLSLTEYSDP